MAKTISWNETIGYSVKRNYKSVIWTYDSFHGAVNDSFSTLSGTEDPIKQELIENGFLIEVIGENNLKFTPYWDYIDD